jgi:hypothetical protein
MQNKQKPLLEQLYEYSPPPPIITSSYGPELNVDWLFKIRILNMQKYVGAVVDVCGSGSNTNLTKFPKPHPMRCNEMSKAHHPPPMPHVSPGWEGVSNVKCITTHRLFVWQCFQL